MDNIGQYFINVIQNNAKELNIIEKLIKVAIIFVAIFILTRVVNKLIDKTMKKRKKTPLLMSNERANTLVNLLKKFINYFLDRKSVV